jgi:hypothetical protein
MSYNTRRAVASVENPMKDQLMQRLASTQS